MHYKCHKRYEDRICNLFGRYGAFVGRDKKTPWVILFSCVFVNLLLMCGLLRIHRESDIEKLYAPKGSEASSDRAELRKLFPNENGKFFNQHAISDFGLFGELIIRTREDINLLNTSILSQVKLIDSLVRTSVVISDDSGEQYKFSDICAVFWTSGCVVGGSFIFTKQFEDNLENITYPMYGNQRIPGVFGNVLVSDGILKSASLVKLRYNLRDDNETMILLGRKWEKEFEMTIPTLSQPGIEIAFVHSDSANTELNANIDGDRIYFSVTFFLMILYASVASIGLNLNFLTWRPCLSLAGILATIMAIGSSLGFTCLIGVEFLSVVGAMPFLIIGIGLDDSFVLMSAMADASCQGDKTSLRDKLVYTMKGSGVAITITSLTDFLAFGIGATSVFLSVKNFCLTTGFAVLFCYLNQLCFFVPCMAINEQRIEERRHFLCCCLKVRNKKDTEGRSSFASLCCTGDVLSTRADFDGLLERYPKNLIKAVIRKMPCKIVILIVFGCYLGISIYGIINLKQGLELKNLATADSYYYKYSTWEDTYFREEFPISIVIRSKIRYSDKRNQEKIKHFLRQVRKEQNIISDFELSWLSAFEKMPYYTDSNEEEFVKYLVIFLNSTGSIFQTDVRIDSTKTKILASRFYVLTNNLKDIKKQGETMEQTRLLASQSDLPTFVYSPVFIMFEQFVMILPSTLQTVGIALAVMVVVTSIFMPQPILVLFVFINMLMVLVGIFGFMYFWDLTLSSVTMIELIMTVGFSVDFSAHMCHAFIAVSADDENSSLSVTSKTKQQSQREKNRSEKEIRVEKAIDRSGGPIINAALSSVVGILMLLFSNSYIFLSFFKLMLLVMLFGLAHAVFFLPVLLSIAGPVSSKDSDKGSESFTNPQKDMSLKEPYSVSVDLNPSNAEKFSSHKLTGISNGNFIDDVPIQQPVVSYNSEFNATIYSYNSNKNE